MNRRGDSRFKATCTLIAAAIAGALLCVPAQAAADPAGDEYTLELPGIRDNQLDGNASPSVEATTSADQAGVAGEALPATPSPLASLGSTVTSGPAAIALFSLLLLVLAAPAAVRLSGPRAG